MPFLPQLSPCDSLLRSTALSGLYAQTFFDISWTNQAIREHYKIDDEEHSQHILSKSILALIKSKEVQTSLSAVKKAVDEAFENNDWDHYAYQFVYNGIKSRLKETQEYVENKSMNRPPTEPSEFDRF